MQNLFRNLIAKIPRTATAPFCPSEVSGSVSIPADTSFWKTLIAFLGPGLLISVGYMDPGNWATDIEAGSKYGFSLLFVVGFASLAAIILQYLSQKLGMVAKRDLARICRDEYSKALMGDFANNILMRSVSWSLFIIITLANLYLLWPSF